jgi:glycosyltransferase involved in cell wall biosynthesis
MSMNAPFHPRVYLKGCRTLVKAGYEVVIIAPHECDENRDGIQIRSLPVYRSRLGRLLVTPWLVFAKALREKASVYQIENIELIPQALLLRLLGKKVIYDVHEDTPDQVPFKTWVPPLIRKPLAWMVKKMEHFGARRFSAVIAAGVEIGERLGACNKQTTIVHNYPLLEEFVDSIALEPARHTGKKIICLGGISSAHAGREIVKAMGLLPRDLEAKLIFAGGIASPAYLDEVIRTPGWERVEYRGIISREQVKALMAEAAAALVLYSPEPNHLDIRSNRFYESLAAGLPVVTSNFPKWRELVEGNGFGLTVDPTDSQAIANAIEYLLTHPEEAAAMGLRGRQAVLEKFNWTREEPKLLQLYAQLLDGALSGPREGRTA